MKLGSLHETRGTGGIRHDGAVSLGVVALGLKQGGATHLYLMLVDIGARPGGGGSVGGP